LYAATLPQAALADGPAPPGPDYSLFDPVPDGNLRSMNPDRPNHTDSPLTIDAGHIEIEAGLADFLRNWGSPGATQTSFSTGEINTRLGISDTVELNLAITTFTTTNGGRGLGDVYAGGKINLWGNDGSSDSWATAMGIKPQLKIPTAGPAIGNGHVEGDVEFPFQINLPDNFQLGLQTVPGVQRNPQNTGYVGAVQNSITLGRPITPALGAWIEAWSLLASGRESRPQYTAETGLGYQIGNNIVLDTAAFFGLNRQSPSFEYVAGISLRF
jgi:hypothetical protein